MAINNNKFDKFTLAAIILICLAVLYFAVNFFMGIKQPSVTLSSSLGQFKVVNSGTISAVKELNACGNWPLKMVGLSADRGNPFSRKSVAASQMTATSTFLCLPVTQ